MAGDAPLYIPSCTIRELVSMKDVIDAMEDALKWFSEGGQVVQPVRTVVPIEQHAGFLATMPALCSPAQGLGVKLVTFYSRNSEKNLPSHHAIVILFEPSTGAIKALLDGETITIMRTAAVSACATKVLARNSPKVLAIVGCGVQARSHAQALCAVHEYSEILVWGRSYEKAAQCAKEIGGIARPHPSLSDAVKDADVIVTVTMATEPVLHGKWLKPGAVVCCVGACRPTWREADDDIMQNAVVFVDSREAALKESGDIILSGAEVFAEIGEALGGKIQVPPVPECGKKFLVFKSLGLAVEDIVTGELIYKRHSELLMKQAP